MSSGDISARTQRGVLSVRLLAFLVCSLMASVVLAQRHRVLPTPSPAPALQLRIVGQSQVFIGSMVIANAPANRRPLFQSCRYGRDFHYVLDHLAPHQQLRIELGFAELFAETAGERVMAVEVNGRVFRDNLDIIAEAGGPRKALVLSCDIEPTARLDLRFVGIKGEALINYVRVEGAGQEIVIGPGAKLLLQPDNGASYDLAHGELCVDDKLVAPIHGMPLGGIGTGSFEILADGTFANLTIGNSWAQAVRGLQGSFLAVRAKLRSFSGEARILSVGARSHPFANAQPMTASRYRARYPFCQIEFTDPTFPLEVSVEAFVPCVPYDLNSSSLPVAIVFVQVRNPNTYPVAASVALSWENIIGRGTLGFPPQVFPQSSAVAHNDAGSGELLGVHMSSLEAPLGARATFLGDQFVGTVTTGVVVSRLLFWDPSAPTIPWWREFIRSGRLGHRPERSEFWSTSLAREGNCAAAVAAAFNLAPRESRRIPFFIAWYYPHVAAPDGNSMHTNAYAQRFASSVGAAVYALSRLEWLESHSRAWRDALVESDLPGWFTQSLLDAAARSAANTVWWKGEPVRWFATVDNGKLEFAPPSLDPLVHAWADTFFPTLGLPSGSRPTAALDAGTSCPLQKSQGNAYESDAHAGVELLAAQASRAWAYANFTGESAAINEMISPLETAFQKLVQHPSFTSPNAEGTLFSDWPSTIAADLRPYKALYAAATAELLAELAQATGDQNRAQLWRQQRRAWEKNAQTEFASIEHTWLSSNSRAGRSFATYFAADWLLRRATGSGLLGESLSSLVQQTVARHLPSDTIIPIETPPATAGLTAPPLLHAWLAAEAIAAGLPNAGFELSARLAQLQQGRANPWGNAFFYDEVTAMPAGENNHAAVASVWSVLHAIVGVHYDRQRETLIVAPSLPFELGNQVLLPVLTPFFNGCLDFDAQEHEWTLSITRVAARFENEPLRVRRLCVQDPDYPGARRQIELPAPMGLCAGDELHYYSGRCEQKSASSSTPAITVTAPVRLGAAVAP
ncbi:MAG: GH116 family glycosyl-hydrolase [Candidatus Sumerlaeaceae bacterium]